MNEVRRRKRPRQGRRHALRAAGLLAGVALLGWGLAEWMTRSPALPVSPQAANAARAQPFAAVFGAAVERMQGGHHREALALWHEAMRLDPEVPEVAVNMGFTLFELGEHAAARDLFIGAIELDAYQANAYYGLAIASEQLGDLPGAMGAMRSYVHLADAARDRRYLRRARAALWEWEARFADQREAADAGESLAPGVEPEQ